MDADERRDQEATQFAISLLMPRRMVKREIEKMGGVQFLTDDIERLADTFQVTPEMMAMRIQQLQSQGYLKQ